MPRSLTMGICAALALGACGQDAPATQEIQAPTAEDRARPSGAPPTEAERAAESARIDREYPEHGLVTAAQIAVRVAPEPEAQVVGWLRLGARVRVKSARVRTPTCNTGWVDLHPSGWACAGLGIEVGEEPPEAPSEEIAADTEAALPYRYLMVTEPQTPEYHALPSRTLQRAAAEHGNRYAALLDADQERRAEAMRERAIPGEPPRPAGVARYLHRGFFVASNGVETRESRRFVRTVRGTYVQEAQLRETTGSDFVGVALDDETTLPIAWAVRDAQPLRNLEAYDGTPRLRSEPDLEAYPRHARLPWLRRDHVGDRVVHVLETDLGERYLRAWFVAVAETREPPRGVGEDEPWIHVDVGEQTLVAYRGARPVYATLVSSGLEGHDTPIGEHAVRRKLISDTMANLGPDAGDDSYRIDDVPWTQYFQGSFALHAAFWHNRFGLRRSHGCVNLAPQDARRIFELTTPAIPDGWHGVSAERGAGFEGARVIVTE